MFEGELFKIALPKGYQRRMVKAGVTPSMWHELNAQEQTMFTKALDEIYLATSDGMACEQAMHEMERKAS